MDHAPSGAGTSRNGGMDRAPSDSTHGGQWAGPGVSSRGGQQGSQADFEGFDGGEDNQQEGACVLSWSM